MQDKTLNTVNNIESKKLYNEACYYMEHWLESSPVKLNMFSGCKTLGFLEAPYRDLSRWMQVNFAEFSFQCFDMLMKNVHDGMPVTPELLKTIEDNKKLNLPWLATDHIKISKTISANTIIYDLWLAILNHIDQYQKQLRKKTPSDTYIPFMCDLMKYNCFFLADFLLFKDRQPLITLKALRSQCTNTPGLKWLTHHESCIQETIKTYGVPIDFLDPAELATRTIFLDKKIKNRFSPDKTEQEEKNILLQFAQRQHALRTSTFFGSQEKKYFNQEMNQLSTKTEKPVEEIFAILMQYIKKPQLSFNTISPQLISKKELNQYKHLLTYIMYIAMDLAYIKKAAPVYQTLDTLPDRDPALSCLLRFRYGADVMTQLVNTLEDLGYCNKGNQEKDDSLQGDEVFRPWN